MRFHTRKWIKPEDLNANGTLFGGRLLEWIDEEAVLYTIIQLENPRTVTEQISEIDDEAFDRLYGYLSHPIAVRKGQKVAVRVISQFGEESTKVLAG